MPIVGETLADRYQIIREVSSGAMGSVYLAKDLHRSIGVNEIFVAVKLNKLVDERERTAFKYEMSTSSKLVHKNIQNVIDFIEIENGNQYIISNFIDGRTLNTIGPHAGAPVSPKNILDWTEQILEALIYIHKKGYYHRDIKPKNIILSVEQDEENVVLIDFGIVTRTGTHFSLAGTEEYAAPEQFFSSFGKVDASTDLYGLASTAYYLLGTPVMASHERIATLALPVRLNVAGITPAVADVFYKALQLQMQDRWRSASDMLQALRQARAKVIPATVIDTAPVVPHATPQTSTSMLHNIWLFGSIFSIIIFFFATIYYAVSRASFGMTLMTFFGIVVGALSLQSLIPATKTLPRSYQLYSCIFQVVTSILVIIYMTLGGNNLSMQYTFGFIAYLIMLIFGSIGMISKTT